jgi:hypothetical protein
MNHNFWKETIKQDQTDIKSDVINLDAHMFHNVDTNKNELHIRKDSISAMRVLNSDDLPHMELSVSSQSVEGLHFWAVELSPDLHLVTIWGTWDNTMPTWIPWSDFSGDVRDLMQNFVGQVDDVNLSPWRSPEDAGISIAVFSFVNSEINVNTFYGVADGVTHNIHQQFIINSNQVATLSEEWFGDFDPNQVQIIGDVEDEKENSELATSE